MIDARSLMLNPHTNAAVAKSIRASLAKIDATPAAEPRAKPKRAPAHRAGERRARTSRPRKTRKPAPPECRTPVRLTLPYPPSVNDAYRVFRGRAILSRAGRAYKASTADLAVGARPLTGEVDLLMTFYRPAARGDLDNLLKLSLDALKGVAFHDDRQVRRIETERHDDQPDDPRVEVFARPYKGVRP